MQSGNLDGWHRNITCEHCGETQLVFVSDLYSEQDPDDDKRLKVCYTCEECGNVLYLKVPEHIRTAIFNSV